MSVSVTLHHRAGDFDADIAFEAPPGLTVLFGPSGAGKTTVLDAVAGLSRPDHAVIRVAGETLTDTARGLAVPPHRRRLGVVFQDGRLFPHLSVRGNLRYGRCFAPRGVPLADEAAVVDLLGLGGLLDRRPGTLSGGERQRVALGRALLAGPRMVLADEPLAALDAARKAEILPYVERLRDVLRVPILYVTHDPAEAARLATTVVRLDAGRVTGVGTAAEMLPSVPDQGPILRA